jgi:hypothetical protein
MPRRSYKKPYRAKKKRPLLAKASFWRSIGVTAAAGGTVWVVCFCPALEVKEVSVEGAQKINSQDCAQLIEEEINKKIAFFDSKSILLFNLEQTKKEILAKFPQVQDIKIVRQFPSRISASVEERRGVAVIVDGSGKRYSVDMQGIAFEEASEPDGVIEITDSHAAAIEAGSPAISKDLLSEILRMKGSIDGGGEVSVVNASIATPERINLLTSEGWYIYFNPLKDIEGQLVKLEAILADESFNVRRANLEYLDIRFTRVYIKGKDVAGEAAPAETLPAAAEGAANETDSGTSNSEGKPAE